MTPDQIRFGLETARDLPRQALRAATLQSDAILPAVLDLLDRAKRGVHLLPAQENLLFYGVHALAAARRRELYCPFVAALRHSDGYLAWLLGEGGFDLLPRITLSVFDGDPSQVIATIEDRTCDRYVRWSMLDVLAQLAVDGTISRELAVATLERFERERLADDGDAAWEGWQCAALRIDATAFADRIRATWRDGRNPTRDIDQAEVERLFQPGSQLAPETNEADIVAPIDDAAVVIEYACVEPPQRRSPHRDETRRERDPAGGIALSAAEVGWLSGFLISPQVAGATSMTLEQLDGYFAGLLTGPRGAIADTDMRVAWGGANAPAYDSPEQQAYVHELLTRHKTSIALRLKARRMHRPLLDPDEPAARRGAAWALGFLRAADAHRAAWSALVEDKKAGRPLGAMVALLLPQDGELLPEDRRHELVEMLPALVASMFAYWHGPIDLRAAPRAPRKIGRNDPCPCGSGTKFKRCCGAGAAVIH